MSNEQITVNLDFDRGQAVAGAGSVEAEAGVDVEQGIVAGALDVGLIPVQKLIFLPFQIDTSMRAAVDEGMEFAVLMDNKNINDVIV